ncbi:MAG: serine/threonine-protein phosphatase, partial [Chloroflexi bacterium]|nr:serine/threonine-protein phosphatase [Chloroflexota bacterium]
MDALRRLLGLRPAEETPTKPASRPQAPSIETKPARPDGKAASDMDTRPLPQVELAEPPASKVTIEIDGRTRQLPPLETVMPNSANGARLIVGQRSDVGQVRENNQDSMFTLVASMSTTDERPDFGLFIVADGMGGHEDGEKASAMTVQVVSREVTNSIFLPLLYNEAGGDAERPTISEVLRSAVQKANEVVSEKVPDGGTTVTAAVIMGNLVYIAHVGDSRAYLITPTSIDKVTRDHSLVERLKELDHITEEEAIDHPQTNVLYRAIGQSETLEVDAITRQIPP